MGGQTCNRLPSASQIQHVYGRNNERCSPARPKTALCGFGCASPRKAGRWQSFGQDETSGNLRQRCSHLAKGVYLDSGEFWKGVWNAFVERER